jgi:hypothetical protein
MLHQQYPYEFIRVIVDFSSVFEMLETYHNGFIINFSKRTHLFLSSIEYLRKFVHKFQSMLLKRRIILLSDLISKSIDGQILFHLIRLAKLASYNQLRRFQQGID